MKKATLRIRRFDPEKDRRPYWAEYRVDVEENARLLDALHKIKWELDGSFTFRRSCGHGVCGSDAMRINGLNRLACKVLFRDVGEKVTIEPLLAFPVIKDLVVDLEPFFAQYEKIKPYLINDEPSPLTERLQTPAQHARYEQVLAPSYNWLWHAFGESSSVREKKNFDQSSQREGCSSHMASLERILELMGLKKQEEVDLGAPLSRLSGVLKW